MNELLRDVAIVAGLAVSYSLMYREGRKEGGVVIEVHDRDLLV